jgi:hypothetical protein
MASGMSGVNRSSERAKNEKTFAAAKTVNIAKHRRMKRFITVWRLTSFSLPLEFQAAKSGASQPHLIVAKRDPGIPAQAGYKKTASPQLVGPPTAAAESRTGDQPSRRWATATNAPVKFDSYLVTDRDPRPSVELLVSLLLLMSRHR